MLPDTLTRVRPTFVAACAIFWWPVMMVAVSAYAYFSFPPEKGCMRDYVRSGATTWTVYLIPSKGLLATHVDSQDRELEWFIRAGEVVGCVFKTWRPEIDMPNTVYCGTTKALDAWAAYWRAAVAVLKASPVWLALDFAPDNNISADWKPSSEKTN